MSSDTKTETTAASTFRTDVKGADVRRALDAAGVRTVLLKGPTFARLFYPDARSRDYWDVDLLVEPARLRGAEETLLGLGFRRMEPETVNRQTDGAVGAAVGFHGSAHATTWLRNADTFVVDLHDSLPQCGAPPEVVWQTIAQHLETLDVGGVPTATLDRPASALLVALHAAHHGPGSGQVATDLERAVESLDQGCWTTARDLAIALQAEAAMGVGLGISDAGRVIARRLSLPTEPSSANRLLWAGAPWSVGVLEAVISQRNMRAAILLLSRIAWPTPSALRRGSALARRGRLGLLAAYAIRPFRLAAKLATAIAARRDARI